MLTRDEIVAIYRSLLPRQGEPDPIAFARAIEQAVRERAATECERVGITMTAACPEAASGCWPDQVAQRCAVSILGR